MNLVPTEPMPYPFWTDDDSSLPRPARAACPGAAPANPSASDLDDVHARPTRRVGPYEIGREIGRGAASRVFVARHLWLARTVAFKELHVSPSADPAAGQRFLREARITGSIDHPNVVAAHDYVEQAGVVGLVMEHVDRGSLRRHIRGGLGLAQAGSVLEDLLTGLTHLEHQRIVHLDIKPDNLLVTTSGAIKIADFGIARVLLPGDDNRDIPTEAGTPQYLAPEQATGGRVGPWTDLYAVGTLAFELLVGRAPFADTRDPVDVVERQLREPVPRVCDLVPGMSEHMADWITWLVAKKPLDRPQTAAHAWGRLEELLTQTLGPSWRLEGGL
jgi:serine/threonine protein kinase